MNYGKVGARVHVYHEYDVLLSDSFNIIGEQGRQSLQRILNHVTLFIQRLNNIFYCPSLKLRFISLKVLTRKYGKMLERGFWGS